MNVIENEHFSLDLARREAQFVAEDIGLPVFEVDDVKKGIFYIYPRGFVSIRHGIRTDHPAGVYVGFSG